MRCRQNRWSGAIATAALLVLVQGIAGAQRSEPESRTRAQIRESVYTLRGAQTALKVFHMRFREIIDPDFGPRFRSWIQAAPLVCENVVPPYCFGPLNGKVAFGAPLYANPVEFKTAEMMVPDYLERGINAQVRILLRAFDDAQKKLPSDRWLAGQRTFHLVEHGEIDRALSVARACKSDKSWCASLVGYASYLLNKEYSADSAFIVALASLPESEQCRWESIGDLLYGDDERSWYVGLPCAEQRSVNRTAWWLADPLYITPGNERFAAHYYREIFRQLFSDSNAELPEHTGCSGCPAPITAGRSPRMSWANPRRVAGQYERDLWQDPPLGSLVRSLGVPTFLMVGDDGFLLQYLQPTYHFIPKASAMRDPLRATASDWDLDDPRASERFHPAYGTFSSLDYQIAFFKRADSSRVIAAVDMKASRLQSQVGRNLISAALVLTRNPDDIRFYRDTVPGTSITFNSLVPAESTLVSLEALVAGVGAARARFASGPPPMPSQRVAVSDLLLVEPGSEPLLTLERAAPLARPSSSVAEGTPQRLFWEVYGLAAGDSITYTMSARELSRSVATRIGRFLGVTGAEQGSSVQWQEVTSDAEAIAPRSITLDLSALTRGAHELQLEIVVKGQNPVRVTREVVITGK
jgi:hypothetical protein